MFGQFPNTTLIYYPHMTPYESQVWSRFLLLYGKNYSRFDYDLRVGPGIKPTENIPEKFLKDYIALTQKRIDAVGYKNNHASIFEVKERALLSPIGQLLGYRVLFTQDYPEFPVSSINLVCASISESDLKIIESQGITVFIV